jgi:hypothetical protein
MADENNAASSTASDPINQSIGELDFAKYSEIQDAADIAAQNGTAPKEISPPSSDPVADPEPAKKEVQERKPKTGEDRAAELKAEIAELLKQRAELQGKIPGDKKTDPPPEPERPAAKIEKSKAPVEPKLEDFATFAEWQTAERAYMRELVKFETREALEADRAQQQVASANKAIETEVQKSIAAGREKYADFDAIALSPKTPISKAMDGFILDSELRADILYRLGENDSAEGKRIFALPVYKQVRALVAIELEFAEPDKKTPVKKTTAAPPPATDLGGRSSAGPDRVRSALASGDYEAYEREANAADIRRLRGAE